MRYATTSKLIATLAAGVLLGGCVQAERTHYAAHLDQRVSLATPGMAPDEVAMAFGLDRGFVGPPQSLAVVDP